MHLYSCHIYIQVQQPFYVFTRIIDTENIEENSGVRGTCNREHTFHKTCLEEHRQFCINKNIFLPGIRLFLF